MVAGAGPGQSQRPRTPSRSPRVGGYLLLYSQAYLQGVGPEVDQPGLELTHKNASVLGGIFTCYAATPAPFRKNSKFKLTIISLLSG